MRIIVIEGLAILGVVCVLIEARSLEIGIDRGKN